MRQTSKDRRIKFAVQDYYNSWTKRELEIATHIAGRKVIELTEEEKSDIRCIKDNMTDRIYMGQI